MQLYDNTERSQVPFTWFPPMVIYCIAIVQCHIQVIDIHTVKIQNMSIIKFTYVTVLLYPLFFCDHTVPLRQPVICSPFTIFYNFYLFQEMLSKWNHVVSNVLVFIFFLTIILWRLSLVVTCINSY